MSIYLRATIAAVDEDGNRYMIHQLESQHPGYSHLGGVTPVRGGSLEYILADGSHVTSLGNGKFRLVDDDRIIQVES